MSHIWWYGRREGLMLVWRRPDDPAARLRKRYLKGEQILRRRLRRLERRGWTVLHDQTIPGSPHKVDHLAIGRSGAWYITVRAWEPLYPVTFDGIKAYCGLSLSTDIRHVCTIADAISSALSQAFGGPVWVRVVMAVQDNPVIGGWFPVELSPTTVLAVPARAVSWRLRRLRKEWSATDVAGVTTAARTALYTANHGP